MMGPFLPFVCTSFIGLYFIDLYGSATPLLGKQELSRMIHDL